MKSSCNVPYPRLLTYCSYCMHGKEVGAGGRGRGAVARFHNRSCYISYYLVALIFKYIST